MKKIAVICLIALVLLLGAGYLAMPFLVKNNMVSAFKAAGFTGVKIGATAALGGGNYTFSKIALDPSAFSSVEQIALKRDSAGTALMIDKLVLTVDWKNLAVPDIDGWVRPAGLGDLAVALRKQNITSIALNSGQMDVAIPVFGLLRLEAKGQVTLQDDGSLRLQATLWSIQQQLKAEWRVNGEITPGGIASFDVEITEGKIALADFAASRMGGWIIMNREAAGKPWQISAQVVAGMAQSLGLSLNALTFSVEGNSQQANLTVQAGGTETDKTALALDASFGKVEDDKIIATLRSDDRRFIARYAATGKTMADMLNVGTVSLHDLSGVEWMRGAIRKTPEGADFDIQNARAKMLSEFLNLDQIDITGALTGLLPLTRNDKGTITVQQGLIRSAGGGNISLSGDALPDTVQSSRKDAAKALKSIAYDSLEIFVNGPVNDQMEGDISLTGTPSGKNQKKTLLTFHYKDKLFK